MMRDCIRAVQSPGHLHFPLLNLVSTFIDGLASGAPGGTKAAYLAYLETHFPDLSASLGAEVFYTKYRCAAVHELGIKSPYGIGRDSGMGGSYVERQVLSDLNQEITMLNIDRLVQDFLGHLEQLLAKASGPSAP
jgi:hypothetical protein